MQRFLILRTVLKKNLIKLQEGTDESDSNSKLWGTQIGIFPLEKYDGKVTVFQLYLNALYWNICQYKREKMELLHHSSDTKRHLSAYL